MVRDLDAFVEPRQKMLTDGTLTEFSEWEVRCAICPKISVRSA